MCSIVGAFSKDKFKELITLNQKRGTFSYSFLVIDPITLEIVSLIQDFGDFPLDIINGAADNMYMIGHTQAPTGGLVKDVGRIHPAQSNNEFLFHNGIIKQKEVERLKFELNTNESWDSSLMLHSLVVGGRSVLNEIDGSFACIHKNNTNLALFRSQAGILFVDDELNISSTKFEGAERIKYDTIYDIDFQHKTLTVNGVFKSKSAPYFINKQAIK